MITKIDIHIKWINYVFIPKNVVETCQIVLNVYKWWNILKHSVIFVDIEAIASVKIY